MSMTWQAGDDLDVNNLNKRVTTWVVKGTTENLDSSTTLQDDDELFINLPANSTWHLRFLLIIVAATGGANTGMKTDWVIPSDATLLSAKLIRGPASTTTDGTDTNLRLKAQGSNTEINYGGDDSNVVAEEEAIIQVVTAGEVQLRWAQRVSDAVALGMRAGSFIRAERIL